MPEATDLTAKIADMHGNAKFEAFAGMRIVHVNVYTVVNMIAVKCVGDMITVHAAGFLNRHMYVMCERRRKCKTDCAYYIAQQADATSKRRYSDARSKI